MTFKNFLRFFLPRQHRTHTILSGELRGLKIVTSWYEYPAAILGYAEKPLLQWIFSNVREGQTWLDIGAHYGFTALAFSKAVGTIGQVFAFEPVLSTAGCLNNTQRINHFSQLHILPFALGNRKNFEIDHLPLTRGMIDSTLPPGEALEPFICTRLDWLWPQVSDGHNKIDGVKIDVQGMEIHVLDGMKEILSKDRPILLIEIHQNVNQAELTSLLREFGYIQAQSIDTGLPVMAGHFAINFSYVFLPS